MTWIFQVAMELDLIDEAEANQLHPGKGKTMFRYIRGWGKSNSVTSGDTKDLIQLHPDLLSAA